MENKDSLCKLDTTNRQIIYSSMISFIMDKTIWKLKIRYVSNQLDNTTDNLMDSLGERKDNPSKTREN